MDDYNLYKEELRKNKTIKVTELLLKNISLHGEKAQLVKTIEELNELSVALAKHLNGAENYGNITEEMADVLIMIKQLELIFGLKEDLKEWRERKLYRIYEFIEGRDENKRI